MTVRGSPGTLIPDTSAVKPKASQSTDSIICGLWYIYLIPLVLAQYSQLHSVCQDYRCHPYSRCLCRYLFASALPPVSPDSHPSLRMITLNRRCEPYPVIYTTPHLDPDPIRSRQSLEGQSTLVRQPCLSPSTAQSWPDLATAQWHLAQGGFEP
jgi:hypothetical protein